MQKKRERRPGVLIRKTFRVEPNYNREYQRGSSKVAHPIVMAYGVCYNTIIVWSLSAQTTATKLGEADTTYVCGIMKPSSFV
jgi:hypothetical protein